MLSQEDRQNYLNLREKVDTAFDKIFEAHKNQFSCKVGCFGCCKSGLQISKIEFEYIRSKVQESQELQQALKNLPQPPKGHCSLLNQENGCAIYEHRPIICRSHGAPIRFKEDDQIQKDVCPLNFQDIELESLPDESILNVDLLNTLLALINGKAFPENSKERIELNKKVLCN